MVGPFNILLMISSVFKGAISTEGRLGFFIGLRDTPISVLYWSQRHTYLSSLLVSETHLSQFFIGLSDTPISVLYWSQRHTYLSSLLVSETHLSQFFIGLRDTPISVLYCSQ